MNEIPGTDAPNSSGCVKGHLCDFLEVPSSIWLRVKRSILCPLPQDRGYPHHVKIFFRDVLLLILSISSLIHSLFKIYRLITHIFLKSVFLSFSCNLASFKKDIITF